MFPEHGLVYGIIRSDEPEEQSLNGSKKVL